MKKYLYSILSLIVLLGCTPFSSVPLEVRYDNKHQRKTLHFEFHNHPGNKDHYSIKTLNKDMYAQLNLDEDGSFAKNPTTYHVKKVLLLEAVVDTNRLHYGNNPSSIDYYLGEDIDTAQYVYQLQEVAKIKESLGNRYLTIYSIDDLPYYFHITNEVRDALQKDYKGFRISIIRVGDGKVLHQSKRVLSTKDLEKFIKE